MTLVQQVAETSILIESIYQVRPTDTSSSMDKFTFSVIELDLTQYVQNTSASLLEGSFEFEKPRYVDFKNKRPLLIIGLRDRAVEKAILKVLEPHLRSALAFRGTFGRAADEGEDKRNLRSLATEVVELRSDYEYAFETDIKKFFPSIDHSKLFEALSPLLPDSSLNYLIDQVLSRRAPEGTAIKPEYKWYFDDLQRGVPQGSCLSPILASVYLMPFDTALERSGFRYIRYVDDLVVFCKTEHEVREAEHLVHTELSALGLQAHRSDQVDDVKGDVLSRDMPLMFVGFEFMPPDIIRPRKAAIIRFKERVLEIAAESKNLRDLLVRMNNFVRGWKAAYSECNIPVSIRRGLDEHQLKVVRNWLGENKALSRNYHGVPKRKQATQFGLELLDCSSEAQVFIPPDSDWHEA